MKESFQVINVTKGPISFWVNSTLKLGNLAQYSRYHQRKMVRATKQQIVLQPNLAIDLVEQTGLTVKQLKDDSEMKKILNLDANRIRVIYDSDIMTPPKGYYPVQF
jgi:hypothetical protein